MNDRLHIAGLKLDAARTRFTIAVTTPCSEEAFGKAEADYLDSHAMYCEALAEVTGEPASVTERRLTA